MKLFEVIGEALGVGKNLTDPKQFDIKEMKRLKYQIEAGQQYVFVDEGSGQYKDLTPFKREKLKLHFRKQLFDSI